jgi:crossover junction endodeoxyribonuclease RuvC
MRIIGIDPGLRVLGWGIISVYGGRLAHVATGLCRSDGAELAARLLSLHRQLTTVIVAHAPDAAAIESTFVNRDGAGTLKLGQARGVALLVPAQAGLPIGEYAPNAIKKAVVGVGHADKRQVMHMVQMQLPGVELAGPDAADALAVAICHAWSAGAANRLSAAVARALGSSGGSPAPSSTAERRASCSTSAASAPWCRSRRGPWRSCRRWAGTPCSGPKWWCARTCWR